MALRRVYARWSSVADAISSTQALSYGMVAAERVHRCRRDSIDFDPLRPRSAVIRINPYLSADTALVSEAIILLYSRYGVA